MRPIVTRAIRLAALLGLSGTGLAMTGFGAVSAVSHHPAHKVAVKIVGIDRNGDRVPVFANVTTMAGAMVLAGSDGGRLAPGQYVVAADVLTGPGGPSDIEALVVRRVVIRRGMTITLDARTARPVQVSLYVARAQQQFSSAVIMIPRSGVTLANVHDSAGTIYVTPAKLSRLCFGVSSRWLGSAGHFYDLVRSVGRGVPSHLAFHFRAATLATVRLTVRSGLGEGVTGFDLQPGGCALDLAVNGLAAPVRETDAVSARSWTAAEQELYGTGDSITRLVRPGRSGAISLGDAVAAPAGQFPFAFPAGQFQFQNISIFSYPPGGQFPSDDCCAASRGTLTLGRHVVASRKFTGPQGSFAASLTRSAWYTFSVDSRRVDLVSHKTLPGVLSPRVDVSWRFFAAPTSDQQFPLTLATYEPSGLNAQNSAGAAGTLSG